MTWGKHLLLDCQSGNSAVHSRESIIAFVNELVNAIGMEAFGEPWVERFATHDPAKGGYSMFQMITTSNISAHFVDLTGDAYIDVFSCKEFNDNLVLAVVDKYFSFKKIRVRFISRNASE